MISHKRVLFLFLAAFTVLSAALFVACGGDDDSSSSGDSGSAKPSGATGSDEAYVKDICAAAAKMAKELDKISAGPTPSDPSKAFEAVFKSMSGPIDTFAKDFAKAKPPKDLAQWHADTAKQLSALAKALKDGKFDDPALNSLGDSPLPDMPKDAEARLDKLAKNVDGCKDADVFKTN
jgi:hypothetical protein